MVILRRFGSEFLTRWSATLVVKSPSSDGPQPHFITIEFPRKMPVQVRLTIVFKLVTDDIS